MRKTANRLADSAASAGYMHGWDDAHAAYKVRIAELEAAARETADQLHTMSMGTEGTLRNRICTASNRLDKALGRQQSSHGEQF